VQKYPFTFYNITHGLANENSIAELARVNNIHGKVKSLSRFAKGFK